MKKQLLGLFVLVSSLSIGQVHETFTSTRVISGHSVETLKKNVMQFRVAHRFGDIAGANGGIHSFFGFDQSSDIRIGFEYGITDRLMLGLGRTKGTGAPYKSLVDGFVKYKIMHQNKDKKMPLSITAVASSTLSYAKKSSDSTQVQSYPKFAHRMAYNVQLLIARKFGERFSLQLMPTFIHRNLVLSNDQNSLFALGGAFTVRLSKSFALTAEYYHAFAQKGLRPDNKDAIGIAFEWITNGHNFKINLTNSRGFNATQFVPYTFADITKGEFRIGFTITRDFKF